MNPQFDAFVTAALFDSTGGAAFALGDGTVRFEDGTTLEAHDGAVLAAAVHPSGRGIVTGGDDGRLVLSRPEGAEAIAESPGKWIEAVAVSPESGLIAFAAGREVHVRDLADPAFTRVFVHDRSVSDLAFDPKGRRIAAATYGGAWLWYARIESQKPTVMKWAGSHISVLWSPDGRFLVSAMQENQLHGWRVADEKNMRMGGYPAKPRSLAFLSKGQLLASAGASGAVIWPFAGSSGPMGREAAEVGYDQNALVTRVAATPGGSWVAAGLEDGKVWALDLRGKRVVTLREPTGSPVSALAITPDGARVAFGPTWWHRR